MHEWDLEKICFKHNKLIDEFVQFVNCGKWQVKNHRHSQKDMFPFQIQYTILWFAIEVIHLHFLQEESQMLTKGFVLSTKASILPDSSPVGAITALYPMSQCFEWFAIQL